jgi:hypothetical protein
LAATEKRLEALGRNGSTALGDSSATAEMLLFEHNKITPECKELQEKTLKLTHQAQDLQGRWRNELGGANGAEQVRNEAYALLDKKCRAKRTIFGTVYPFLQSRRYGAHQIGSIGSAIDRSSSPARFRPTCPTSRPSLQGFRRCYRTCSSSRIFSFGYSRSFSSRRRGAGIILKYILIFASLANKINFQFFVGYQENCGTY